MVNLGHLYLHVEGLIRDQKLVLPGQGYLRLLGLLRLPDRKQESHTVGRRPAAPGLRCPSP